MAKNSRAKLTKYQRQKAKLAQKAAKEKVKELRAYMKSMRGIDLRKNIDPARLGYITRAFNEYQELTARPVKIFRSKNKKHLAKAQAYSRHDKGAPKFDVAFVPVADPKAKLIFKGDEMRLKTKYITETVIFFDLKKMAVDPAREIERSIAKNPNADQFVIMAGKYLFNGGIVRSLIVQKTVQLMARYNDPEANNFWGNWLFGLVAAEYNNQQSFDNYRREYRKQQEQIKAKKQRARRSFRQKYGKENL